MNNSQHNTTELDHKLKAALEELDQEWVEIDGAREKTTCNAYSKYGTKRW